MANSGRPKKDDCNNIIKVSVNDETASMLDTAASLTGKSKSDILRELIPLVSSRTFEDMISSTNMELLQQYSEDCWRTLHTEGCIFETAYFSDKMPAFISTMEYLVYVKYPTFKIEILNEQNPFSPTNQDTLEQLLKDITNRSLVSANRTEALASGTQLVRMRFPYVNEVTCLELTLEDNIKCKDKIVAILSKNGYRTSVYPAYCLRPANIEFLENKKYFKVLED